VKHKRLLTQPLAGVTSTLDEFPQDPVIAGDPGKPAPQPLPKIDVPPKKPSPAADDQGARITLMGTVTDHLGRNAGRGQVWLPVRWLNPLETLTVTDTSKGSDPFRLTFPEAWLPEIKLQRNPIVWAYAHGHAIGTASAQQQLFGAKPGESLAPQWRLGISRRRALTTLCRGN
jgi:hypothetical protein